MVSLIINFIWKPARPALFRFLAAGFSFLVLFSAFFVYIDDAKTVWQSCTNIAQRQQPIGDNSNSFPVRDQFEVRGGVNVTGGAEKIDDIIPPEKNSTVDWLNVTGGAERMDDIIPPEKNNTVNQPWKLGNAENYQRAEAASDNYTVVQQCDLFSGKWVHDDSYPLYNSSKCKYLSAQVSCQKNQRPDSDYEKWRWQPNNCNIPRFNASDMLERIRGKRLMFVGDSINRNQWESMVCLLDSAVPNKKKSVQYESSSYKVFRALEYGSSVEFFWAPFLVELEDIKNVNGTKKVLRLDSIENHAKHWKGVDILVFNSVHWWTHSGKIKAWDLFQQGNHLYKELNAVTAYQRGLKTWAKWIESNVDPQKTKIFFRSISPTHSRLQCYNETVPLMAESYQNTLNPSEMQIAVEDVLRKMKVPVSYLNITRLSDYRKDAHPSVYTERHGKMLTMEQRMDPDRFADCSHWCLPGLPDIWNELLYASLL